MQDSFQTFRTLVTFCTRNHFSKLMKIACWWSSCAATKNKENSPTYIYIFYISLLNPISQQSFFNIRVPSLCLCACTGPGSSESSHLNQPLSGKVTQAKGASSSRRLLIKKIWYEHGIVLLRKIIWGHHDTHRERKLKKNKHLHSIDTCVQLSQTYSVHVDNHIVPRGERNQTSILFARWSVTVLSGMRKKEDSE